MRVLIKREVTMNLTGYDRDPVTLETGEQEIPERAAANVASWLRANPAFGHVLDATAAPASVDASLAAPAKKPMPQPEDTTPDDDESAGDALALADMSVADLRARATELGVDKASRLNKGQLVTAIEEAMASTGDAEDDEE